MDDICAVMDAAGMEKAALLGISEGGSLAALFAATHPERCGALILYGSFARFSSWFPTEDAFAQFLGYIDQAWALAALRHSSRAHAQTIRLAYAGLVALSVLAQARPLLPRICA